MHILMALTSGSTMISHVSWLYSFLFTFSLSFTSYVLASLALFRMIGTFYPLKYIEICSYTNAKRVIICIVAFTILVHIQTLFRFRIVNLPGQGPVCTDPTDNKILRVVLILVGMLVLYIIPMFLIVVSSICIIWKLVKRRANPIGNARTSNGDHAFSRNVVVLLAICLV